MDQLRPEEQATHFRALYEDLVQQNAQQQLANQRGHVAMIAEQNQPNQRPAAANQDGDGFVEEPLDLGDNTYGSNDYNAVASTFKRHVYRKAKFSSPNVERTIATMVLDHMNKRGFVFVKGPKTSRANQSKS